MTYFIFLSREIEDGRRESLSIKYWETILLSSPCLPISRPARITIFLGSEGTRDKSTSLPCSSPHEINPNKVHRSLPRQTAVHRTETKNPPCISAKNTQTLPKTTTPTHTPHPPQHFSHFFAKRSLLCSAATPQREVITRPVFSRT